MSASMVVAGDTHVQGQHVIAETQRLSAIELGICPGFGDHKRK